MSSPPPTPSPNSSKPASPRPSSRGRRFPATRQASRTQIETSRHSNDGAESPATLPTGGAAAPIPDEDHGAELPLTMTASVILTGLPKDAHRALTDVEAIDAGKVTVRFHPLPSAPILTNRVFKISASQKFETVVRFLRKKLDCKESDSVFCYVNSVFAPGLDESVGGLWRLYLEFNVSAAMDRFATEDEKLRSLAWIHRLKPNLQGMEKCQLPDSDDCKRALACFAL
ncbi:Ubiquitin-like protein [Emydomyces testavorans]|uniref:Ubiquitin-like protein ATG12 n=1 Tax=Emydomyces testavorans TaxID=2070801 RepID=A0AAF0DII2_9EURO|nr:Ubiquitin-like protein [Emydomyces testavorans]